MGKRRGFLPPAICEECKHPPLLGESLWPDEKWRCFSCLEKSLPGEDGTSKSMHKMLEYGRESRDAFELEFERLNAEEPRNRAQWAKAIAGEIHKRSEARSKEVKLANGEALPTGAEKILHDTLTVPDLASVEASFDGHGFCFSRDQGWRPWLWMPQPPYSQETASKRCWRTN
jgi:hypothetical protein